MKSRIVKRLLTQATRNSNNRFSILFASATSRVSGGSNSFTRQTLPILSSSSAGDIQWISSTTNDNDDNDDDDDDDDNLHNGTQSLAEEYEEDDGEGFDEMSYSNYDDDFDDDDNDDFRPRKHNRNHNSKRDEQEEDEPRRLYLDPSTKLEDRVDIFLNRKLGTMHPLDIRLSSVDLIRECGKMNSFEGMKFAHDILDRILEEKRFVNQDEDGDNKESVIFIAERPFQVLMYGWSNLSRKVSAAPERMREVLELMIQEAEYDEQTRREIRAIGNIDEEVLASLPSCQPTVDIYNTLLQGLGQASYRSIAAAGEAEVVLNVMIKQNQKRGWHTKPTTKSFTLAITAFGKTQHSTAGKRAEAILRKMIEYHEEEKQSYLEETGTAYNLHDPSANVRNIVTPDTIAYSAVIQAHAKSNAKNSAEAARDLLAELLESDHPSLVPDAYVFANTINAYSSLAAKKKSPKARLEAAENAEELVWLMVDQLEHFKPEDGEVNADENPNVTDPPKRKIVAKKKKNQRSDGLSSVVPFNACLNAWAASNAPGSAVRAEELLHKMLDPEFVETTGIIPNTTSFNTCMQAWAKASSRNDDSAPEKAEELLSLLTSLKDGGIATADITSYSTVMTAYAKSNRPDKAVHTRRLLEMLISSASEVAGKLSAVPFTVVLNAVAHSPSPYDAAGSSSPKKEEDDGDAFGMEDSDAFGTDADSNNSSGGDAYSIGLKTYMELQQDMYDLKVYPDHLVYSTMLDVIAKHTDVESIERRQRVEQVMEDACAAGEVSTLVVGSLQKACSKDMLQHLLQVPNPTGISSVNAFPRAWTRKVQPRFRRFQGSGGGGGGSSSGYNNKNNSNKRRNNHSGNSNSHKRDKYKGKRNAQ
ncbi:unnamed protein product [Cylindrotheca closterium]|uniref:Uncharacterized protein n=1 Tax=Cylindrotheca closterium TaxID=2856 RepID=A0AAD2G5E8_9STRA|nr:unnamed protein product [Cylindrotheca closterium]